MENSYTILPDFFPLPERCRIFWAFFFQFLFFFFVGPGSLVLGFGVLRSVVAKKCAKRNIKLTRQTVKGATLGLPTPQFLPLRFRCVRPWLAQGF